MQPIATLELNRQLWMDNRKLTWFQRTWLRIRRVSTKYCNFF